MAVRYAYQYSNSLVTHRLLHSVRITHTQTTDSILHSASKEKRRSPRGWRVECRPLSGSAPHSHTAHGCLHFYLSDKKRKVREWSTFATRGGTSLHEAQGGAACACAIHGSARSTQGSGALGPGAERHDERVDATVD